MNTEVKSLYGVKFHQMELNHIKALHFEAPGGSTVKSSSLAVYILLHFKIDTLGRIREDEFVLKPLAEQYGFHYSTLHKGFHELFDLGLLQYIDEHGIRYIQISGYDVLNQEGNLNYFILPKYILDSRVLAEFVHARDVSGIIGLLDLINSLSRENTKKGKFSYLLKCTTLLRKMKKPLEIFWIGSNGLVHLLKLNHKKENIDVKKNGPLPL